ncbi:MAG: hypothetical protein ABWX70_10525 [Hyphomicrobium sp.]
MGTEKENWQFDLMTRHARLFVPYDRPTDGAAGYPICGAGWQDLLERAMSRIERALGEGDELHIHQVKEKLGGLRIYWRGHLSADASAKIEEAVDLAEARAECTCETCGREGRLHVADHWFNTACPDHAKGAPVDTQPASERLHVVRKIAGRKLKPVRYRRYDRDADIFVDVDPPTINGDE